MAAKKRFKTNYAGVYYIESTTGRTREPERIYYVRYRKDGKMVEEKAGRQYQDNVTAAKAAGIRAERMQGKEPTNRERREARKAAEQAEKNKWTIDRLWKEYKARKGDYPSLRTDESNFKPIQARFGGKEPKDLIQLDVDRLRITLLKKRKPQTVKHVLSLLNRIVNYGVRKQLCTGLNFQIEMPPVSNAKTEDLTSDQLQKLLDEIEKDDHPHAGTMMKMALFTGMRRGELFKLKWKHIDFERGFINIIDPKGGPDQKIPLNDSARELLNSHPCTKSRFVFPGRDGRQRVNIAKQVKKIKEAAGLPDDFRPLHGLRHVYASMLASSGEVGMYELQKLLTHKDPKMTQRYAHLRDYALKKAGNVAGDLIKQSTERQKKKKVAEPNNIKK